MKWIKEYTLFKESKSETIRTKDTVRDICVSMVLLNNTFLDNILDRGLKARYSENSKVFLTDLKNLLLAKNRLNIAKFIDNKCVPDEELSKINVLFDTIDFDIEKDWDKLSNARTTARNIIDKLLPDVKLSSDDIRAIYWNIEKIKDHQEDIVVEDKDGNQYSFYLNKNIATQKSASFNLFADDLIGTDIDRLYKEEYLSKWDKLTQEWIRLIYENANKNIQQLIERFIDAKRIDDIGYFEYYDIRHKDPKFKHLGEFLQEFDKNILKFSDLLNEVWKSKDNCFMDSNRVVKEWAETKIVILNSKIIENLLTSSLKSNHPEDIQKVEGDWKLAGGTVKMKLFKTLVKKMGCLERPVYFLGKNGDIFNLVPSREFFREHYDNLKIKFDYHVNFEVSEQEDNNDFTIKIKLELDGETLIDMFIIVKFSGGEMSSKLSCKYKFDIADNFNYLISRKQSKQSD